jgi:hypothetical protein
MKFGRRASYRYHDKHSSTELPRFPPLPLMETQTVAYTRNPDKIQIGCASQHAKGGWIRAPSPSILIFSLFSPSSSSS